jgi:hypothetical protein
MGAAHCDWTMSAQEPVIGSQHAPVGCGQGFGEQLVHAECQTLGGRQFVWVLSEQCPVGSQHAR